MSDDDECKNCGGGGFVWLDAVRSVRRRQKDGSHAVAFVSEPFRVPCDCAAGAAWLASRLRGDDPKQK